MNPSDAHSHLATLRQLKEMLDAGTITPTEFEALKQQLVFGKEAVVPAAPPALAPEPVVFQETIPEPFTASPEVSPASFEPALAATEVPPVAPPPAGTPETPDWMAAAAPMLLTPEHPSTSYSPPDERRNPLTLVFAVGGALVLLAIVLYLALGNRAENEHIASTSQTAADSTAVAPEVGPQGEQITLPPAAPETVRVAPATPPPVAPAAATKFRADSAVAPAAMPAAPAAKAPATPAAADTAI